MNWLEESEKEYKKQTSDIDEFHINLKLPIQVFERIKRVAFKTSYLSSDFIGNGKIYKCLSKFVYHEDKRVDYNLHSSWFDRIMSITHSDNSNIIEWKEEVTTKITKDKYFGDGGLEWELDYEPKSSKIIYNKNISDTVLKSLDEESWIVGFGWLINKNSDFEIIDTFK
jgi:hypothetical protein